MSKSVHRAPRGAKADVHPPLPTAAQAAWLEEVRALLALAAELGRSGQRIRHARHEAPEVAVLDYLVSVLPDLLPLAERARREGRPLEWVTVPWEQFREQLPALRLGPRPTPVIPLAPYIEARKAVRRG